MRYWSEVALIFTDSELFYQAECFALANKLYAPGNCGMR